MNGRGGMQMQMTVPFTPVVKALVIINVAVWIVLELIVEKMILSTPWVTQLLGLVPAGVLNNFFVWQVATYMFVHSYNPFHILFNMLMLWWLGGELEQRWGSRFFLLYYMASGIGAAILYIAAIVVYSLVTGSMAGWLNPVVGASGAIFGLLLAYGILFGERIVYFLMMFPMRAKYFVMILGAVELVNLLNTGLASDVSNLAHLGGLLSGFLFLQFYTRFQQRRWRKQTGKRGRGLRLVVNNDKKDEKDGPRYWN